MRSIFGTACRVVVAAASAAALTGASPAAAQTVYNVPSLSDFSGPFAAVMPLFAGGREAVIAWWNAEVGAKIGVRLNMKGYDTRYDASQTASLWPGILAESKPLIGFALGGPDFVALQQRLPQDKVPMILGSAANGFSWRPNQWILTPRPTFVHELAGFTEWFHKNPLKGARPVKVALVASEATPVLADIAKGFAAYAKANPKSVELVETLITEIQPADMTLQIRRVVNAGADVVLVPGTTQQAVAVKRALQALGRKVPLMLSMHNSPSVLARALGGIEALEGDYEAQGGAIASAEDSEAKRFYDLLASKYGLKAPWNALTGAGIGQALVLVRAVEAAARKHGADKLTGDLVYRTLIDTDFGAKEFSGFVSDLDFAADAPFPTKAPKVNIGTVNGGKLVTVATGVPVPRLTKW